MRYASPSDTAALISDWYLTSSRRDNSSSAWCTLVSCCDRLFVAHTCCSNYQRHGFEAPQGGKVDMKAALAVLAIALCVAGAFAQDPEPKLLFEKGEYRVF
jgi:hypothetical protein